MLAAFNEEPLSPEAAAQLARMTADATLPRHSGRDLKLITEEELIDHERTTKAPGQDAADEGRKS